MMQYQVSRELDCHIAPLRERYGMQEMEAGQPSYWLAVGLHMPKERTVSAQPGQMTQDVDATLDPSDSPAVDVPGEQVCLHICCCGLLWNQNRYAQHLIDFHGNVTAHLGSITSSGTVPQGLLGREKLFFSRNSSTCCPVVYATL